jgi:hypothetical protein
VPHHSPANNNSRLSHVIDLAARLDPHIDRRTSGGDDGGMPPELMVRVERLESDVKEIRSDQKTTLRELAELKGNVTQLPTVWQVVALNVGLAIGVAGLVATVARYFTAH